jgi:hypothetical protein
VGISYFVVIRRRDENVAKSGTLFLSGNLERVNETIRWSAGGMTYPGRYIVLRSVAKSVAASEDGMRGQPLGDSAVARFAFANI